MSQRVACSRPLTSVIDDLDAHAKARGGTKSNTEQEQTLDQLLTELHDTNPSVTCMWS